VHPNRVAVLDGERRWNWAGFAREVTVLAQALRRSGVRPGDRVAFLGANSAELLAAHFAVPLVRAALVALNVRLSPSEIAYICEHSGATLLLGDGELLSALDAAQVRLPVAEIVEVPEQDGTYHSPEAAIPYADFRPRTRHDPQSHRASHPTNTAGTVAQRNRP
jgi:fatty-acyl-CoA synthase